MSITPLLTELFGMTQAGFKPGLERITALCEFVGNPERTLTFIHVAGTNGKGSTSAMLASILQCAGYKVGLYTSPHIRVFNERVRINGKPISDGDIERLAKPLMSYASTIGGTFFEITTALALQWFAEQRAEVVVLETGLGGRLDATNIVTPILSVITYIDVDHVDYLGRSITGIAAEKAGIIKEGAPVVVGPQGRLASSDSTTDVEEDIYNVFADRAQQLHSSITLARDIVNVEVDAIRPDLTMTVRAVTGDQLHYYDVGLAGNHQAGNVATVLAAIPDLQRLLFITPDHVREGLLHVCENTGLEGRIQLLPMQPPLMLDVSHNPGGIRALHETLTQAGYADGSWHVVFGAMADKDILGMLQALRPLVSTLHLCSPHIPRAATTEALEQLAHAAGFQRVSVYPSVAAALERARMRGPALACGSFHVADEVLQALST
ncbi:MAG: bifunctional folylpolyglutamate synthase/dihydrofolate synthase [Bradyrhizobiaceae bacterium]|nr:bifunctional folylpolyglutamate synthase/dihydrofolate synthase [Bradyrhizobiaceae bacterium]